MRKVLLLASLMAAPPALADLAPDPTDPTEPMGALLWITIAVAAAALAVIWWRRRNR